ncbi:MAG: hk02 [Anaerocolumna sp.]|jgi:sensor histidine kinase YesM|nr:hk02 [Anaerocolumna sp.]
MDALFYFGINVIETLLIFKYMNVFYKYKKPELSNHLPLVVGAGCSIMMTVVNLYFNSIFLIIIGVVLNVFAISAIYKEDYKNKLVLNSLYIGIVLVTSLLSAIILTHILGREFFLLLIRSNRIYLYLAFLFNESIKFILVHMICRMRQHHNEHITFRISVLFSVIPLITIVIIYAFANFLVEGGIYNPYLSLFITLGLLYMNVFIFYIFDKYNAMFTENMEKKLIEQELRYKDDYYRSVEENQKEIRSIKHNLKNQQIAILQLFEDGEYKEAADAIRNILSAIDNVNKEVYTQNSIVNSILNTKLNQGEQFDIDVNVDVQIPAKLHINTVDLGVILGNLLDNAVEACAKCDEGKRFIDIKIGYHKGNLFIDIKNSMPGNGLNRILQTTKTDKLNHGLGLRSVKGIIEKYYGTLEVIPENFTFDVRILINED